MVAVVQTATDRLEWSPHVHAMVSRGGWRCDGKGVSVPHVETRSAELLFRHQVIACLRDEGLLTDERIELLLSWRHTGFSVHNRVTVEPGDAAGTERLARYLLRPPLSLERMSFDETGAVLYQSKASSRFGRGTVTFDAMDFLPRLLMHIPHPRLHTVRYYGEYSSVVRTRRRAEAERFEADGPQDAAADESDTLSAAEGRRLRRSWTELIRRIYEVDPLTCQCGARMRILAFTLDPQDITRILRHLDTEDATHQRAPPPSPPLVSRPSLSS
jgi:hypothetical protein